MEKGTAHAVDYLVVGAGVSGLGFANFIREEAQVRGAPPPSVLVVEKEQEPGGYCRTVVQDGFVWDYSGHFFHFRHPELEAWLRARMPEGAVRTVNRKSAIRLPTSRGLRDIDFPFQKNIHQLPRPDFDDCVAGLHEAAARGGEARSFKDMLAQRYGRGICDRFLVPYNEKLYACDLDALDKDAMGRFFPAASIDEILAQANNPKPDASYNATFTYPDDGAIAYIRALLRDLPPDAVALNEAVVHIDRASHTATTAQRRITYRHLVTSAPLPATLSAADVAFAPADFHANQVLVFNLGFDKPSTDDAHWIYFPDPSTSFYRVGFYNNIHSASHPLGRRMSLYVELGQQDGAAVDLDATRARVLDDLRRVGIVRDHTLVSHHSVLLRPAYVHITAQSRERTQRARTALAADDVHAVGRYGGWTYCSIEDNLVEVRALATTLAAGGRHVVSPTV